MFLVPVTRRHPAVIVRAFDRLFDDALDRAFASDPVRAAAPAADIVEADKDYTVSIDLPGVAKDDVKVSIEGRRVSIEAGFKREEEKKDGERIVWRERASTRCARTLTLPVELDQAASSAKLDNGVLTLVLAKRVADAAKQLTIN